MTADRSARAKLPYVEPTGVLVVRVWMEGTGCAGVRARISQTLDVSRRDESVAIATTVGEIHRIVCVWLKAFADAERLRRAGKEAE